jgi:hypothetical protein
MQLNIMAHKEGAKLFYPLNKQADLQVKFFQSSNEAISINQHQSTVSTFSNPSKLNLATAAIFHIIPTANPYRPATNDQQKIPTTRMESKIIIPQSLENGLQRAQRPENLINFNRLNINSPRASTVSNIVDNMQKGAFAAHLKAVHINEPPKIQLQCFNIEQQINLSYNNYSYQSGCIDSSNEHPSLNFNQLTYLL